jgi:hypothetical protein
MLKTPVLLITFNRPEHTHKVLEEVKKQQPEKLFVFQDGAREGNKMDTEKCVAVRETINNLIDWNCELHTNFSEKNLGCGKGPATAITWFFENVEEGIIIEDDTIPSNDFFGYAEELLQKYRNNNQIMVIGSVDIDKKKYGNASYYFSMMNRNLYAWATWKRAWQNFDYFLENVTVKQLRKAMKFYQASSKEILYWSERLKEIHKDRLNESSWDIQFLISIWINKGIGICPNVNLSTNIGFGQEATHTFDPKNPQSNVSVESILPLIHLDNIKIQRKADLNYHKIYFAPYEYGWSGIRRIPYRLNKRLKLWAGHDGKWFK